MMGVNRMEKLKKIVSKLITFKQEGAYWDFKCEWYDSEHYMD